MNKTRNHIKLAWLATPTVHEQIEIIAARLEAQPYPVSSVDAKGKRVVATIVETTLRKLARDLARGAISIDALRRYEKMYATYPKSPPELVKNSSGAKEVGVYLNEASLDAIQHSGELITAMDGAPSVTIRGGWAKKKIIAYALIAASE